MKIYRWFWSHTIGRPFTYWRRDVYHLAPLVNIVVFVTVGFLAGFFYPTIFYWVQLKWYHLVELFALAWFIGVLQSHFYWGKEYVKGQKGE